MRVGHLTTGILLLFLSVGACKRSPSITERPQGSELSVVGGKEAQADQFPATLFIPGCSAAKIGPQHILTAAHCILDDAGHLEDRYQQGETFIVYYGVRLAEAKRYEVTVLGSYPHPVFQEEILKGGKKFEDYPDVAVIRVKGLPEEIPAGQLFDGNIANGQKITFTGYGCEALPAHLDILNSDFGNSLIHGEETYVKHRLKHKVVNVAQKTAVMLIVKNELNTDLFDLQSEEKRFSGCPGDSGSVAYLEARGALYAVGVNSFINPLNSYITRLDPGADHGIYGWVRSQLTAQ